MERRAFLDTLGAVPLAAVTARTAGASPVRRAPPDASLLVPMDQAQTNHLKAYGVAFQAIEATGRSEWLLNYRGGSFLLPDGAETRRRAALAGVALEPAGADAVAQIHATIEQQNMDAIPLERTPRVAIY